MSIKISELPQAANVGNNDFVPIVQNGETKKALASDFGGGGGGTSDYTDLTNKPSINSVTLTGDKTSGDLNLVGSADIATTIDSTSTNSEVAGAKAVYDATLDNYSTTERVVGTWIDGKPLYEKTFFTAAPTTTDGTHTSTNVRYANNVEYAFIVAHWVVDGADQHQPLPYINNAGNQLKGFITTEALNGHGYYMDSSIAGYNGATIVAIIRYTKTTDTAPAGLNSINPSASLMNTGSLVGMGDRAELLGTTETEVETKESGDTL